MDSRGIHTIGSWLCILLAGCGATAEPRTQRAGASGATPGASCGQNQLTQACQCEDARPGRQVCQAEAWSACECADPAADGGVGAAANFEGNQRTDITFEWERTPNGGIAGDCLPGDYEGNFAGVYYSMLAPQGLGVPVANLDPPDAPSGFHFTVEPAQGGETIQRVKGEMNGTADLAFPFKARIEGELDCKAATFVAQLIDGSYSVLADGFVPQKFDGVMVGRYDHRTHTFIDGSWDVRESSAMPPGTLAPTQPRDFMRDGYGGSGEWAAGRATDVNDPTLTQCPANYTCKGGPLGPNKLLCNGPLGVPTCLSDAECEAQFPGEGVMCLKASAFSLCLRECKP
jgi:hypothetical protein